MILETIGCRRDLKQCNIEQLQVLSEELRQYIFDVVAENGGHLSSNLGAVELTVAMLYVFDEDDRFLFDVGHQSYAYKILTGRRDAFADLRKKEGVSGFSDCLESAADSFCSGHSSTSISAGLGLCAARDLAGEDYHVVSVIGDGAMGGGEAFEGLNNMEECPGKFIVVLNDNEMSIARNVGSLSKHFARIRTRKSYIRFKHGFAKCVQAIPLAGKPLYRFFRWGRDHVRNIFAKNILFEHFHLKYFGTVDGHNLKKLISALEVAKEERRPALVHVHTVKGKGFPDCEARPDFYHGVAAGLLQKECPFSKAAGEALCEVAAADEKVVAVTAAMKDGTGLAPFAERFPDRFFDVGIAEQHAATFACGLAKEGFKPFFAVYSTFLQRAFDQVVIDGCANDLPVKLLVDRAGLVGADGRTHQGVFDVSYLSCIPDMTLLAPKDAGELGRMIRFAKDYPHPIAIRYPNSEAPLPAEAETDGAGVRGAKAIAVKVGKSAVEEDKRRGDRDTLGERNGDGEEPVRGEENFLAWEVLREGSRPCAILAAGNRLLAEALRAAEQTDATVISARCLKPLDSACLERVRELRLVTMEENVLAGGFGSAVAAFYAARGQAVRLTCLGVGDAFVRHATIEEQFAQFGLTAEHLVELLGRGE